MGTLNWFVVLSVSLLLLASACAAPKPPPAESVGHLAEAGKALFANRCAKCHGIRGEGVIGPALMGSDATLEKFRTADRLYEFISLAMPFDAPGTLSPQEYEQVLSYLLVQNNFVSREAPFSSNGLEDLLLEKR